MRNQFFDPGFLFDFYSDRWSTATPSARSNVSWAGLNFAQNRQSAVFAFFSPIFDRHLQKTYKT